jgi:DNA polymerase epsilon subunit 2
MPIPEIFTKHITQRVPNMSFVSNPCRVRYFTQEIVIFREDLLKKMQRHVVLPPTHEVNGPDITEQLVESILDQVYVYINCIDVLI